ncbi:penicillin-binding protein activator [Rheinheimera maricola]|uniref:Penicillin-binding protein activator n=1 Tax=Rheinheimera maricola TaxID=2793282 RepID=A0ABS7X754_9GAMM|nr:penicillin-binding protein activator [Rheinheimera maricola]
MTSSKLKPVLFLCVGGLLSSCAQSPQSSKTVAPAPSPTQVEKQTETARQLYPLAANYQAEQQHYQLLKVARQAIAEKDFLLALAISENLKLSPYPAIRQQNKLPLLQAYLATKQQTSLLTLLEKTELSAVAAADRAMFLWLSAQYHAEQGRYLAASETLLSLQHYIDSTQPHNSTLHDNDNHPAGNQQTYQQLLWRNLAQLSDSQLDSLKVEAELHRSAWLNLAQLSRRYIGQPEQLQQAFSGWQQRYNAVATLQNLPDSVRQLFSLIPYQPQKIAILLPMQGRFRQHAQAIQYGILAAAGSGSSELVFIDSEQSTTELHTQVSAAQAEFVIGPLLKEQVDSVSRSENWTWPTLFLNTIDSGHTPAPEQFYFALSMEDEASQMAQLFQQKNYLHPVVISATNTTALRMQQHFVSRWQQLGHQAPLSLQFDNKEQLEALIGNLLETDTSEERVKLISNLLPQKLEAEPHSRLDIDAIYLLADPVQTRLFKPFIDVSVSPTAPRLPIYASSRSHSTSLSSTDLRDLNGLTFTEMPWMLDEQSNMALRQQYQQLFSDQDETLQRLFAMGYDAVKLVGSLRQQQQLPSAVFPGLTGQLSLNQNGSIVRRLSWASYRNNRLSAIQEP